MALRNPGVLGAFELLVNTYARPRYEEIDPTILIAVTFPLLYGAMYGDVGHGLVLAAFGALIASKAVRALRGAAPSGRITRRLRFERHDLRLFVRKHFRF